MAFAFFSVYGNFLTVYSDSGDPIPLNFVRITLRITPSYSGNRGSFLIHIASVLTARELS
jgi:hypothetical protein